MNALLLHHDRGPQIDMAILDFSKAFDTVPHEKLLHKWHYGPINNWFRDFLTNRRMQVVVDGGMLKSSPHRLRGSTRYSARAAYVPMSNPKYDFADDCLLYRCIKSTRDHITLQKDLEVLEAWAEKWGMRFNAKKCYIISISNKSTNFTNTSSIMLKKIPISVFLSRLT